MLYESSADANISLPSDSGAVLLSFWLLYCPPGASAGGPACFPAGTAVRDVLHAAQAAAEQGEAHAATQQTLLTLRLRVPAACAAPRDVLARVLGPSACALPGPGGGRAVAALPFAGAVLRAQAPRKHAADLQLAMPTAPHASRQAAVLPLVRATPVMPCALSRLSPVVLAVWRIRRGRRCYVARSHTRRRRPRMTRWTTMTRWRRCERCAAASSPVRRVGESLERRANALTRCAAYRFRTRWTRWRGCALWRTRPAARPRPRCTRMRKPLPQSCAPRTPLCAARPSTRTPRARQTRSAVLFAKGTRTPRARQTRSAVLFAKGRRRQRVPAASRLCVRLFGLSVLLLQVLRRGERVGLSPRHVNQRLPRGRRA